MKKLQLLLATLVCSLVFVSAASADIASFFALDTSSNGTITFTTMNADIQFSPTTQLQYATGNSPSTWTTLADFSPTQITVSGSEKELISFRLLSNNSEVGIGLLQFYDTLNSGKYDQAVISWAGFGNFTLSSATAGDSFAPVPVPPAAYLLASGVIGLITLRRKKAADLA